MTKITLPCIMPMIVMMLTLQVGISFVAGFDKVLLLYKPITYETADCLSTYTYRLAFGTSQNYGLSSASGLFGGGDHAAHPVQLPEPQGQRFGPVLRR